MGTAVEEFPVKSGVISRTFIACDVDYRILGLGFRDLSACCKDRRAYLLEGL